MLDTIKNGPHSPDPERASNFAALGRTSTERLLKSQDQWKLPGSRRTMVKICTYYVRTLASESSIEPAHATRMARYNVMGLAETRRRHPFNAVYDTGEELFRATCDSKRVGGVGVLVNMSLSMNIDSFEQLTTRIRRLRLKSKRELTSEFEKQCRQAIEDLKGRRAAVMVGAAEAGKSIWKARRSFANYKTEMVALRRLDETITASGKAMEKIIHEYSSDLL